MELGEKQIGHKRKESASTPEYHFQVKIKWGVKSQCHSQMGTDKILEPNDSFGVKNFQLTCWAM